MGFRDLKRIMISLSIPPSLREFYQWGTFTIGAFTIETVTFKDQILWVREGKCLGKPECNDNQFQVISNWVHFSNTQLPNLLL